MTLIITHTGGQVLQFSDRRVSLVRGAETSIHSSTENKTVIFLIRDAVGVLGYTGNAYVGNQTTDSWLAGLIAGEDFATDRFAYALYPRASENLNTVIWRIRNALADDRVRPPNRLTVVLSGYRVRGRLSIPFFVKMSRPPGVPQDVFKLRPPRSPNDYPMIDQVGDPLCPDELSEALRNGEIHAGQSGGHPVVAGLVLGIRARAARSDLVGADVMGVMINPPHKQLIEWRFIPASPGTEASGTEPIDLGGSFYSPWIITPSMISAPAVGNTYFTTDLGGWVIRCLNEAPATDRSTTLEVERQPRPARP